MSLNNLIQEYEKGLEDLQRVIEEDNFDQVKVLDNLVVECFNKILSAKPSNDSDRILLAEFLLKQLLSSCGQSQLNEQISGKIVELVGATKTASARRSTGQ